MNLEEILRYLKQKYGQKLFLFSQIMLEKDYNPEHFGLIIQKLIDSKIIVPSIGGSSFSSVKTKRGDCWLGFDIFDEVTWNRFKRGYYAMGFTNAMREKILRLHKTINRKAGRRYPMDFGRLNWKKIEEFKNVKKEEKLQRSKITNQKVR